jgi:hypothetical protein
MSASQEGLRSNFMVECVIIELCVLEISILCPEVRYFVVFFCPCKQILGQYFKTDHNRCFRILSNSLFTNKYTDSVDT